MEPEHVPTMHTQLMHLHGSLHGKDNYDTPVR